MSERYRSEVTTGPGGVMTDEVGVVTGDLTVVTEVADGQAAVRVQYTGAEERYIATGSPLPVSAGNGEGIHEAVVAMIRHGAPEGVAGATG
ncbi:hypothetical protein OG884_17605 [Streptosporangium sp. NBC_01755]|uniref:hypothetical protein n=1 Tax=unclassified Streptosporangium TaxID=2632669 RepID=UPI002DD84FD4|nr:MULTISPECIES: hypothetical protein [unclassified Streptosporangium]WSA25043.1 hypothetical protein OIE13_29560 [Streptosporangium sp. NBC_01810]WSD03626.1 hypothetical protein OG884_17605 [Streptosporangium sp. NBC_01755]